MTVGFNKAVCEDHVLREKDKGFFICPLPLARSENNTIVLLFDDTTVCLPNLRV